MGDLVAVLRIVLRELLMRKDICCQQNAGANRCDNKKLDANSAAHRTRHPGAESGLGLDAPGAQTESNVQR